MGLAAVTRDTMYFQYRILIAIFRFCPEKIFVDLIGHLDHLAGNIFFRFLVAGHVPIGGIDLYMTKITFHSQRSGKLIHDFIDSLLGDIFWKHFQILKFLFRWLAGGYADNDKYDERGNGYNFIVELHTEFLNVI